MGIAHDGLCFACRRYLGVQKWTIDADEIGFSILHKHKNALCDALTVVYDNDSSNIFFVGCVVRHKPTTLSRVLPLPIIYNRLCFGLNYAEDVVYLIYLKMTIIKIVQTERKRVSETKCKTRRPDNLSGGRLGGRIPIDDRRWFSPCSPPSPPVNSQ